MLPVKVIARTVVRGPSSMAMITSMRRSGEFGESDGSAAPSDFHRRARKAARAILVLDSRRLRLDRRANELLAARRGHDLLQLGLGNRRIAR